MDQQPEPLELPRALRGFLQAIAEASNCTTEAAVVLEALYRFVFARPELLGTSRVKRAMEALASADLPPEKSGS